MTSLARCERILNSYQITARGLFSLLLANSCFSLYYAQHYSLRVLRKLTEGTSETAPRTADAQPTDRWSDPPMSMDPSYGNLHNQADIDRFERIQRRAARFIVGDYRSAREG